MASYLLFEGAFCRELIACGYRDAMAQEEALMAFFYPQREILVDGKASHFSTARYGDL